MKKFQPTQAFPLLVHFLKENNLPKVAKKLAKHCSTQDDSNPLLEIDLLSLIKQHITDDKQLRKRYKKFKKSVASLEPEIEKKRKNSEALYKKEDPLQNYQEAMNGEMHQESQQMAEAAEEQWEEYGQGADYEEPYGQEEYIEESHQNKRNKKRSFSRVSVHLSTVKRQLRDNSFSAKRGDQFGEVGQQMLGGKHGKDFKKQKTKLKNKNFHGGKGRSINLEPASVLL